MTSCQPAIARETLSTEEKRQLKHRAAQLVATEIDCICAAEYNDPKLAAELLDDMDVYSAEATKVSLAPVGTGNYWETIAAQPLLSPTEERELFRRWNFYKYRANQLRSRLNPQRPVASRIREIERLLAVAAVLRDRLVTANLRLVVANARQFCSAEHLFEDLLSDGNLALIQAIEKFDYSRGFRFSTYATYAIRRTFFRRMTRKQRERQRLAFTEPDLLQAAPAPDESPDDLMTGPLFQRLMQRIRAILNARELQIVIARFNLEGGTEPPTLQTLAERMGICKERVRQLQIRALEKLRTIAQQLQSEIELPSGMMTV